MAAPGARADTFPSRPVRLIVPFPPGGATDIVARLLSEKLEGIWHQNVLVDYKPGAGTVIGTDIVAKSAPDGYTLGIVITGYVINPSMREHMPYDTLKDLSGVSMLTISHILLSATKSLPANNLNELIALAKKEPGALSYATPGVGTAMHLAGELLKKRAGIDIVHVPYKGGATAYPDLIAGRVQLQFDPLYAMAQIIKSGQAKPIAITSPERAAVMPDVPTFAETLSGFSVLSITGVVVPSATPRPLVHQISTDINSALKNPDLKERMAGVGMEPAGDTPEQFDAYIKAEIEKWAPIVKEAGLKVE
ncbi:MAG: tripartite tricarboxylate transporter substrate binding protein [Alphaproteobacteria bacterium]|nr:tripartite tricarboxylate transporter substrate binding protein [Alphaproteobacteria bacterium]